MRIHIVGICGTFMAGVALIARELGFEVSGCDQHVYPPMSDVLAEAGIDVITGYDPAQLDDDYDHIIIGNAFSRGHTYIEAILEAGHPYCSGPQWLAEHCLHQRHVLAVSGTHGKTTTSSMLTWVLQSAGLTPGYLIGGAPNNFEQPAALGDAPFFVIEADEYDTAFFDKRSKFLHYRPRTLLINNLEYDHADIFPDLAAIQTQFHHLVRTVPAGGKIIVPDHDAAVAEVLERGSWTPVTTVGFDQGDWQARAVAADGSQFELWHQQQLIGTVYWSQLGIHNVYNALAASAAAYHVGVADSDIIAALESFAGVRRRMELFATHNQTTFYDDFAHHPTAIESTLTSLRARVGEEKITVFLQCGSRTMQLGTHQQRLAESLANADQVMLLDSEEIHWDTNFLSSHLGDKITIFANVNDIVDAWQPDALAKQHVLLMSNKSFDGLKQRLLDKVDSIEVT